MDYQMQDVISAINSGSKEPLIDTVSMTETDV